MGSFSLMHWIVVLAIIIILFGAGKLPRLMGDCAKGIKTFKAGMKEEDEPETTASPDHLLPPGGAAGPRYQPPALSMAHASPPRTSRRSGEGGTAFVGFTDVG